jgi:hypothetical protein
MSDLVEQKVRKPGNGRFATDQLSIQKAKRNMLYAAMRTDEPRDYVSMFTSAELDGGTGDFAFR